MTRLADRKPPACACCYQQKDCRYVDFEAAYDGAVIPGTPEPVPVDDLIICEGCLEEAFSILDPQGLRQTIEELTALLREANTALDAKDRAIKGAESTITELVEHPVAKLTGRPSLRAVSEEVREEITRNRLKRRGSTTDPTQKKKAKAA